MAVEPCVLVTGASRGLGAALVRSYLEAGQAVAGCSRGDAPLAHERYRHHRVDVCDEGAVVAMFGALRAGGWAPRLVINNAGLAQNRLAVLTKAAAARAILEVNLLGAFIISREAMKAMQRQGGGRIVNLSSINVPLASAGGALYNASKAGLEALGATLAQECRPFDITVNSIGLSLVAGTGMAEGLEGKAAEEKRARLMKPATIDVAEVVAAIDYFASPLARNVTAQTLYFGGVR